MPLNLRIRFDTVTTPAGECPMCGFDSLRRTVGYHLSLDGVTTIWDQAFCGRCINDVREGL